MRWSLISLENLLSYFCGSCLTEFLIEKPDDILATVQGYCSLGFDIHWLPNPGITNFAPCVDKESLKSLLMWLEVWETWENQSTQPTAALLSLRTTFPSPFQYTSVKKTNFRNTRCYFCTPLHQKQYFISCKQNEERMLIISCVCCIWMVWGFVNCILSYDKRKPHLRLLWELALGKEPSTNDCLTTQRDVIWLNCSVYNLPAFTSEYNTCTIVT